MAKKKKGIICDPTFGNPYHCPNCKLNYIIHECFRHPLTEEKLKCKKCGAKLVPGYSK